MKVQIGRVTRRQIWDKISGLSDEEATCLLDCLTQSSELWIGMIDEQVACVWGLASPTLLSTQAYIWLYITPVAAKHEFLFVRRSQIAMQEMLTRYTCIVGHTEIGNDRAIRWLKWLGARFGEPEGKGIPFVIRKKDG